MADDAMVRQLLEEVLNSGRSPEEVCADQPEFLEDVRSRWLRVRHLAADLEQAFPTSGPVRSSEALGAPGDWEKLPYIQGYELDAVIGHGGMGVVYRARHMKLDRVVAIKMLLSGDHASAKELAGLMREAQAVAGLKHAHIVQCHDFGELDGLPYFTMEYLEGGSLAKKLDGKPMPAREAAALVETLAAAVQAAHIGGIIHRDLKPGNILLAADGTPKITDFGLARRAQGDPGHTLSAARVGTPSYMAPEQALGTADSFGPSVDIYALGAILYETLTGRPPFRSDSPSETQRQVVEEEPAPPSRLNARVPRDLETVCLKCLQKDPRRRYSTVAALAEDLRRFLDGVPVTARRIGPLGRAGRWARRRPSHAALVVGSVLVLLGLAGVAVWAGWQRSARDRAIAEDVRQAIAYEHALDWNGARAQLERAKGRLGDAIDKSGVDSLHRAVKQLEDDLALVTRLEKTRMDRARFGDPPRSLANAEAARDYQAALREAGLVDISAPPESSAAAIKRSEVREAVIVALDDWVWCAGEHRAWVARVLSDLDTDPWRNRLRDRTVLSDRAQLEELATTADLSRQPPRLVLALGRELYDAGGDGIRLLRSMQDQYPTDFWTNFELGLTLAHSRDPGEAMGFLRAALAIRPDVAAVRFYLGTTLMDLDRVDEAIREFERALEAAPNYESTHVNLGVCLQKKLQWEESIIQLREAIRLEPGDPVAHNNLGRSLGTMGHLREAIPEYRESLRLNPGDAHVHNNLAITLAAAGDKEGAITEFQEAVRLDPKDAKAQRGLGQLLRDNGRLREAAGHLQQTVTLEPKNTDVKNELRGVLIRLGEVEEVRAAWQQELEADPQGHGAWDGYAELCLFLGREPEYTRTRRLLLERFGATTDPHTAERTARACLLLPASDEQVAAATALINRALRADRSRYEEWAHPFFMFAKGLAEYRQNRFEESLALMRGEASAVLGPAPGLVRAMSLSRLGQAKEARKELASAIARFHWYRANADIRDAWVFHTLRREAEPMILPNLPAFLDGKYQPQDNDERMALLGACQFMGRYAAIAGLYADAFAADPTLAEDLRTSRRYNAACAAALAASGKGEEPTALNLEDRARWRDQARRWLLADLGLLGKALDDNPARARDPVRQMIRLWRADVDLAGVRDPEELNKLPAEEREKCLMVWTEADALLRRTQAED